MRIETIIKKIEDLEKLANEIEDYGIEIMKNTALVADDYKYKWNVPSKEIKKAQRKAVKLYQKWYSLALQLVNEYLKEREEEFINYYEQVMNYLQLGKHSIYGIYSSDKNKVIDDFLDKFDIQRGIIFSISDVVEVKEMNLRKLISADFVETELEEAEILFKNNYIRAAGALAGVALEKNLQTMCYLNNISYRYRDTIDPLATKLYRKGVLDLTELKKIQHLASIRNKCDHPNEIKKEEVKELIKDVKKFVHRD